MCARARARLTRIACVATPLRVYRTRAKTRKQAKRTRDGNWTVEEIFYKVETRRWGLGNATSVCFPFGPPFAASRACLLLPSATATVEDFRWWALRYRYLLATLPALRARGPQVRERAGFAFGANRETL